METDRWEFSSSVTAKAQRYVKTGRVSRQTEHRFEVKGSEETPYTVTTDAETDGRSVLWADCTCKHGRNVTFGRAKCSHSVAVLWAIREEAETCDQCGKVQPEEELIRCEFLSDDLCETCWDDHFEICKPHAQEKADEAAIDARKDGDYR